MYTVELYFESTKLRLIENQDISNLGAFLLPWLIQFECDELVIGYNISKAIYFLVVLSH